MLALTGYELGLLVVALVFIAFALVAALVIPRARPDFPARYLGVFVAVCIVLFLAQMGAVLALAELGEGEEAAEGEPPVTMPTETTPTETTPPPEGEGDAAAGREIFLGDAGCGSCHALADAGTSGAVGPNLDSTTPSYELVVERVTNGMGVMPSFADRLSEEQIADVAAYVSSVAGS